MNSKVVFAALFIAMLATTAAYASPSAAASAPENSALPERNMAPFNLVIPVNSMQYEINGSLYAWLQVSGYLLATTNIPGYENINVTIRDLYIGIKVTLTCKNITIDSSGHGSADVDVTANMTVRINVYYKVGSTEGAYIAYFKDGFHGKWTALYFVPWGDTNNFTAPIPSISPDQVNQTTASPMPLAIMISQGNITEDSIRYNTVRHVRLDFGKWMANRINKGITDIWTAIAELSTQTVGSDFKDQIIALLPKPYLVRSVGYVDLWKADGTMNNTQVSNILIMAGAFLDVLIKWDFVRSSMAFSFRYNNIQFSANVVINFHANLGLTFSLMVTSNYFRHQIVGNTEFSTLEIEVPENATLVWRKIGVIVYYGGTAEGIDVTGGESHGNTTSGGKTLFFVDYGWDGTPDFASNGTGRPIQLGDDTGTTSGQGNTRTVYLKTKQASGIWIYFGLDISGYRVKSVTRSGGLALNTTQYWFYDDEFYGTRMLYVCDDPVFSYTVELTSLTAGGLPIPLLIIGALAVVVVVGGLLVLTRRRSSSNVSIK